MIVTEHTILRLACRRLKREMFKEIQKIANPFLDFMLKIFKREPEYQTVKPDDDGWVDIIMEAPDIGFKMRFKPSGNWDNENEERYVLIDYVRITQPRTEGGFEGPILLTKHIRRRKDSK